MLETLVIQLSDNGGSISQVSIFQPSCCETKNISGQIGQYYGLWYRGSFRHQAINNVIYYAE